MSEYYGSEGFDHPPSDVYSYGGGFFGDVGAARGVSALARPWYNVDCVFVCVCGCFVFVCVLASRCLVCRPSHLCVCPVGTPPAR
jgi:hypothetical protein